MDQIYEKTIKIYKMESAVHTLQFTGNIVAASCLAITVIPIVAASLVTIAPVVGAGAIVAVATNVGAATTGVGTVTGVAGSFYGLLNLVGIKTIQHSIAQEEKRDFKMIDLHDIEKILSVAIHPLIEHNKLIV